MRQALAAYRLRAAFSLKPVLALLTALAIGLASSGEAAAAKGKYAAIVVDANTGKTLFSANADQARYPASLT